jgi:hypothetical protein
MQQMKAIAGRHILPGFVAAFVLVPTSLAADKTVPRSNIVILLVDDVRADSVACIGYPFVKTPHIGRSANGC